jgi:hypothetical protein
MRAALPVSIVDEGHSDYPLLQRIADALIDRVGSVNRLEATVGDIVRTAIDSVIDTPKTTRRTIDELEKTEKTYLGTRIEILFRHALGLKKGRLDLFVDGIDVDVKFTTQDNWMIPREAIDAACVLIAADEATGKLYAGLIVARREYLNPGNNQDQKKTIARDQFKNIYWLVKGRPYPQRFWKTLPPDDVEFIFSGQSGTERLVRLFDLVQKIPVNRNVIEDVAQQLDYMKRLRKNGGARDVLAKRGVRLLSGKYDQNEIRSRGLPPCDKESFISVPENKTRSTKSNHG